MMKHILIFSRNLVSRLFIVLALFSCSGPHLDDQTVAVVNHDRISKQELEYSIDFFPQYTAGHKGARAVRAHLDLLIDRKLFAQLGRKKGFDKSPHVQRVLRWVERDEMIRALYRKQVRNRVHITDDQVRQAFAGGLTSYHVRHIFARTEEQARAIKRLLDGGVPFEKVAARTFQDSVLRANGGDLGWLTLSEMDQDFARAVASLPVGAVSDPVRTKWGYHIIQVENVRQRVLAGQAELKKMHQKIERELRRQKEEELAGEYVKQVMDRLDVRMNKDAFNLLAAEIKKVVLSGQRQIPNYRPVFGGVELKRIAEGMDAYSDRVLITFNGGQWTIAQFMDKLKALPVPERPHLDTPNRLINDIGIMVRNEFLYNEAKRQHLDQDSLVRAEVKKWKEEFTFSELWKSIQDTLSVSDKDVSAYHHIHKARYYMPERVHVREILLPTQSDAENILKQLQRGEDFATLARQYSLRTWAAQQGGDLGLLVEGQYGNISRRAMELRRGQIDGPVRVSDGWSVIQCLGHKPARPKTLDEARDAIERDVRSEKETQLYQRVKSLLRKQANIRINTDLLKSIEQAYERSARIPTVFTPIK